MSRYPPPPSADPEPPAPSFGFHPTSTPRPHPPSQPGQSPYPSPPQPGLTSDGKARSRRACDSCSVRKVRCDESGPPCRNCATLDIPCTFQRPSRRRGPPNRHAEAIKKRNRGPGSSQDSGSTLQSPIEATAHVLTSLSSQPTLSAESICSLPILSLLIDDFFTYIHPLVPLPHEPTFRAAWARREDLTSRQFLALLAAMIGTLVSSFPRRPRQHLNRDAISRHAFPSATVLVETCHRVAVEARGPGYLDQGLSVYDAATSYFLAVAGSYIFNFRCLRVYLMECVNIMRVLDIHKSTTPSSYGPQSSSDSSPSEPSHRTTDFITQELGRRLFYVCLATTMTLRQFGSSDSMVLMPPPTLADPYPPLPLEIDDAYIFSDHIDPQPPGLISEITGFNANVRVYSSFHALNRVEIAYGIDETFDWDRQKRILDQCLVNVKTALDTIPEELLLRPGHETHSPDQSVPTDPLLQESSTSTRQPPVSPLRYEDARIRSQSGAKRKIAYEIQKANIYVSQIGTRSYIVDKYFTLYEAQARSQYQSQQRRYTSSASSGSTLAMTPQSPYPNVGRATGGGGRGGGGGSYGSPGTPGTVAVAAGVDDSLSPRTMEMDMVEEREAIVRELLVLLRTIRQEDMEPNGGSFVHKIRHVASTLLSVPSSQRGQLAIRSEHYLSAFLDILMRLERLGGGGGGGGVTGGSDEISSGTTKTTNPNMDKKLSEEELEEQELRHWADMKDLQRNFMEKGGFLGVL